MTTMGSDPYGALDDVPVLIWISGADYCGTYFNKTWLDFTGRTLEEECEGGWMSGVHPDDLPAIKSYSLALQRREPFQAEYRLRRKDGAWRWMLDRGRPRFDNAGEFDCYVGACVDVTELREAEKAHRRTQDRLQLAQEAAAVGTYDWDVTTGQISWSPEMFFLYGIDPETDESDIYTAWLERLHPEDRDRADEETRQFVENADRLSIEFRIIHPESGLRFIQGRGRMIRDEEGRPLRMIGVNLDVTDQKTAENALRETEQRLSDIAAHFPGIIFRRITYPDGHVEYPYFSGGNGSVFHIARERLEGMRTVEDIARLIHYEDVDEMLAKFRHAAATMTPLELEGRLVSDDGETRWIRSLSRPRPGPEGSLIWDGVQLDVTDQHLRESARERAVTMLRLCMEVAGIGTWEFDPDTETIIGSGATNALFGLPDDDQPRPVEDYIGAVHPDDVETIRKGLLEAALRQEDVSRDYRVVAAGDTIRWLSSKGSFCRLADGSRRMLGALYDITEQKRREEHKEAALQYQKTLLKELHHRVNNNLQMILSLVRMQASRLPDGDASDELSSMADRIQAISDLQAQLSADEKSGYADLGVHLRDFCKKLNKSLLAKTDIDLRCNAESCLIDLDRVLPLRLIVNELVTNSIKHAFGEEQHGVISISLRRGTGGAFSLRVCDNGRGLGTLVRKEVGGFGMKLVEGLCQQMGATIDRLDGPGVAYEIRVPAVSDRTSPS